MSTIKLKENERENLVKIAYWYYKRNLTQAEIAKRLGYTRQKVNQIIGSLIDLGIVEININGLTEDFAELEYAIENRFNLKRVCIINSDSHSKDEFYRKAAETIDAIFDNNQTIGLSWGETLGQTVQAIHPHTLKNSSVVQLAGGLNSHSSIVRPDEITRLLAKKLNCAYHILYAPAFVDSAEAREIIVQENTVQETFSRMKECDLAILGVGELSDTSTLHKEGFFPQNFLNKLISEGCVGDIAMLPFKADGTWYPLDNIVGIDKETLGAIPNVVILAQGVNKAAAVLGAIHTGCVDTVIIDKNIAKQISKQYNL